MRQVSEIAHQLSNAHSLDAVVSVIRKAARELTGADGACIILRDEDRCYYVDEDAIGPLWKGRRFPMSSCISGWAMLNRQAVIIEDIYQDNRIPADAYRPTFVKSLAMVPIRPSNPVGAIGNYWASHRKATSEEIELLQALADHASIALENARLISELQSAKSSLEEAIRSRDEFLSVAAHELRTPLTSLKLQIQMTENRVQETMDEKLVHAHEVSLRQVNALATLVEKLLDVSRIRLELLVLEYSSFDLSSEIIQIVEEEMPALKAANCSVNFELEPDLFGEWDINRFAQIMTNLLSNAAKYAPGSIITIKTRKDGRGSAILEVKDNGPGISKDLHERIFRRFQRGVGANNISGMGLGLFITKSLVEAHRGHIQVESESGKGARFIIDLPLSLSSNTLPRLR